MASTRAIYRQLTIASFREYARDPLPTLFSFIIPLFFIFSFGITAKVANAPMADVKIATALIGESDALDRAAAVLGRQRGVTVLRMATGDPRKLFDENKAQVALVARDGQAAPEVFATRPMRELGILVAGLANGTAPVAAPAGWHISTQGEKRFNYFAFLFPSIIALALLQVSLFGTATPIVNAKEKGVFKHYAVVPMPRVPLLLAQISVRLVFAVLQVALLVLVGWLAFGVTLSHPFLFALVAVAAAILLIICGYALAGLFRSTVLATVVLMLLNFYCMLFGQLFVDMSGMAGFNWLVLTTPVGLVSDSLRHAALGTTGIFSVGGALAAGVLWLAAAVFAAIRFFKFTPGAA